MTSWQSSGEALTSRLSAVAWQTVPAQNALLSPKFCLPLAWRLSLNDSVVLSSLFSGSEVSEH